MRGTMRSNIVRLVEFCARHPWPVLVSAAVIAATAGFYAVDHFAITTNVMAQVPAMMVRIVMGFLLL